MEQFNYKYTVYVRQGYAWQGKNIKEIQSIDLDMAHSDWANMLAEQLAYCASSIQFIDMDEENLPYAIINKRNEADIIVAIKLNS